MEVDVEKAKFYLWANGFESIGEQDPIHFEYRWEGK
jgi:hypothetical protein